MNKDDALELAERMSIEIPKISESPSNGDWTKAVYLGLVKFKNEKPWKIFPSEEPYLGEYHCDFMLFEDGYGCRLACESQWLTSRSNAGELEWAFDKLRGVKSDVKLLFFEGFDTWKDDIRKYLEGYAQLDPVETFVFMRWMGTQWERFWWKPLVAGVQKEAFNPIQF